MTFYEKLNIVVDVRIMVRYNIVKNYQGGDENESCTSYKC